MQRNTIIILFLFLFSVGSYGQKISKESTPFVGAQIFIEPGQSEEQIEHWFKLLKENHMTTCRIRMFGKYMKTDSGSYDFRLFDTAFRMADKYGVKVYATLFPDTDFMDVGGFKFPRSYDHQREIEEYIKNVVTHFSNYKCLTTWVLINEPGISDLPFKEEFTKDHFSQWKKAHTFSPYNEAGYMVLNFEKEKFAIDYHSWFLHWLAEQVRKYDKHSDLHVNPNNVFRFSGLYDFPTWRTFLNSLGGSAHASWHFGYFPRKSYSFAMSANAELLRSGAGELPWLMTELQGGNNLYSGSVPMCPTSEEILQWLMINYATEAKGGIFWSFNSRATAAEAGEWALINYKGESSDRLSAASRVGDFINKNKDMMSHICTLNSGISILYNHESLWVENVQGTNKPVGNVREVGSVMRSSLAYFETLSSTGFQVSLKEFGEFDFSQNDYSGQVIILSHQIALDDSSINQLESFVSRGGTLIADGLTGYYDFNAHSTVVSGFALEKLFGGFPMEFKMDTPLFYLALEGRGYKLPAHLWKGYVEPSTATPVLDRAGDCIGTVNRYGRGCVYWVPSPVALGARYADDYSELSRFTLTLLSDSVLHATPHFGKYHKDLLMKSFTSNGRIYSLVINKSPSVQTVDIVNVKGVSSVLFADKHAHVEGNKLTLASEETVIIEWKK